MIKKYTVSVVILLISAITNASKYGDTLFHIWRKPRYITNNAIACLKNAGIYKPIPLQKIPHISFSPAKIDWKAESDLNEISDLNQEKLLEAQKRFLKSYGDNQIYLSQEDFNVLPRSLKDKITNETKSQDKIKDFLFKQTQYDKEEI